MLQDDYGYSDMVSGVPVMIGAGGAEQVIEMTLKTLQKTRFKNSVASVQEMVDALYSNNFFDDLKEEKKERRKNEK